MLIPGTNIIYLSPYCSSLQKLYKKVKRKNPTHDEEIKQLAEPDPVMAQILELLDTGFTITVINMLKI